MNYSPAFKWFVVLLLPVTLCWKLVVQRDRPDPLKYEILSFLTDHQFNVIGIDEQMDGLPLLVAEANRCRMLIGTAPPHDWQLDTVQHYATSSERVFFVFRGQVYATQPTRATVGSYLSSVLYKLGL